MSVEVVPPRLSADLHTSDQALDDAWFAGMCAGVAPYLDSYRFRNDPIIATTYAANPEYAPKEGTTNIAETRILRAWFESAKATQRSEPKCPTGAQPVHSECSLFYHLYKIINVEGRVPKDGLSVDDSEWDLSDHIGTPTPPCLACCRMLEASRELYHSHGEPREFRFFATFSNPVLDDTLFFIPEPGCEWEALLRERLVSVLYEELGMNLQEESRFRRREATKQKEEEERKEMGKGDPYELEEEDKDGGDETRDGGYEVPRHIEHDVDVHPGWFE